MKSIAPTRQDTAPNKRSFGRKVIMQRQLIYMSVPFVLLIVLFSYVPLWGWVMAFQRYTLGKGIKHSPFVGFDNFVALFQDEQFYHVLRNTLAMGLLQLITGFVCAIALALLLNEVRFVWFKRVIQTITYIPHFVSWVVIANITLTMLSPDDGMLNRILMKLGIIQEPLYFMGEEKWFWFIHTTVSLWKELGWSTIIFLAVLVGLNPEQYEAAEVDGASRFQKMWYISIPGIMPTAILLLILNVGWIIQGGFESQYLLGNPIVVDYSEVLDLYALRYSTQLGDFSFGVAISMFKSVVSVVMVLGVNYLAKKTNQSRLI
ncbi:sugar ABC transporter permease [Paenibacillus sp. CF384]|uniref:ABC transporter permease n=1 Tax=Paenibacillus sp. CF384 TaxID=1884382 RepID=UPI000898724F|nr:ABC transporter permease subunit [Paenibacillus sp. CF384]SDX45826.1 putative aldouronate transport system permease protein [Paenibacillus sp. CF384]